MRLYLLRHGESEANVAGIINDDPYRPVALTPRGCEQAEAAAEGLRAVAISHAYASQFLRARQTADILLAALGLDLPLRLDPRLNERRSGLDGRPVEAFNGLVRPDPVRIRPVAGESFLEQMARVGWFFDDAAQRHPDAVVLAVTHENPILAAAALAGRPVEEAARGGIGNCEWIVVEWPTVGPD